MPALPFCHVTLKAPKPRKDYPKELNTLGDHLRKKRLDLGLTQGEVAKRFHVHATTVRYWETNRVAPGLRVMPWIIHFLGYALYKLEQPFSERLRVRRQALGLSQKELADAVRINESTLGRWESGRSRPRQTSLNTLEAFFRSY